MAAETFSTSNVIRLPRKVVWDCLRDPDVLRQCIPGCSELLRLEPRRYRVVVPYKLGPLSRTFRTNVTITDAQHMTYMRFHRGGTQPFQGPGQFAGEVWLQDHDAGTQLDFQGELQAPGTVMRVVRMIYPFDVEDAARRFVAAFEAAAMAKISAQPQG